MKQQHTLIFFISLFLALLFCSSISAQNKTDSKKETKLNDSIKHKLQYGLRVGADISKLVRSSIDDDYKGFEIIGDYRITKKWYAAGEIGTEEKTTNTDNLEFSTSGSFFKVGADYNFFDNWFGMENMIYSGFRVGASTFSHQRNRFSIYNTDQYWTTQLDDGTFVIDYNDTIKEFKGLSAIWLEFMIGLKAELFNNLYIGVNAQLKRSISQDEPDNFENLYIPGFNRTYDNSKFGVGYGYSISYLIPFYKKANKKKVEKEEEKEEEK